MLDMTPFTDYTITAPMGKTAVSETNPRFGGVSYTHCEIMTTVLMGINQVYVGSISHPDIKEKVETASLILSIGALKSDFNTGNFTYSIPTSRTVEVCRSRIGYRCRSLTVPPFP